MRAYTAIILPLLAVISLSTLYSCGSSKTVRVEEAPMILTTNSAGTGPEIVLEFWRGKAHNHALAAIWIEDTTGHYLQTLYVANSIARGVFGHGDKSQGFWQPGAIRRPAALPYWSHQRGIQASDGLYTPSPENPVPDAYTGPTPPSDFILESRSDDHLPAAFNILLEINQPWDWNEFWTNSKYPDDVNYKTSAQPSLIYLAKYRGQEGRTEMLVAGRGHHSGSDGTLYTDLETMTTALHIADSIFVTVRKTN